MRIADHEINLHNIESWPNAIRWSVYLIIFLVIMVTVYFLDIRTQLAVLTAGQKNERQLKFDLESKYHIAANLLGYKKQLQAITNIFQSLLEELPGSNELSDLLDDISGASKTAGLEIMNLVPQKEQPQSFYVLFPIQITVVGRYHQMGNFVSKLAGLNRIVIPGNYTITAVAGNNKNNPTDLSEERLSMVMQINTYRYIPGAETTIEPRKTSTRINKIQNQAATSTVAKAK